MIEFNYVNLIILLSYKVTHQNFYNNFTFCICKTSAQNFELMYFVFICYMLSHFGNISVVKHVLPHEQFKLFDSLRCR